MIEAKDRVTFDALMAVASQTKDALLSAGSGEEFAQEVYRKIELKAGSTLPPVVVRIELPIFNTGLRT